jgi:hypothetical protein
MTNLQTVERSSLVERFTKSHLAASVAPSAKETRSDESATRSDENLQSTPHHDAKKESRAERHDKHD